MSIHYADATVTLFHGDCLDVLRELPDCSVDAVVCDPPYGLANTDPAQVADTITRWVNGERDYLPGGSGFMGKAWDAFVPPVAVWDDCLRVLKPGGHVLAFAGSRTMDLMTLSLRLAGFDIRDSIAWLYGSGFPKSLDVSKAIDKARDDGPARRAVGSWLRAERESRGIRQKDVAAHWPSVTGGLTGCVANWEGGFNCPTWEQWLDLKRLVGFGDDMDAEVWRLNGRKGTPGEAWESREVLGHVADRRADGTVIGLGHSGELNRATSDAAQQWQGWGTALKPAFEPVVVARKPLTGTVAANVLQHGTGALNIDACRVGDGEDRTSGGAQGSAPQPMSWGQPTGRERPIGGRWPANVVLDESQAEALDQQSGETASRAGGLTDRRSGGIMGNRDDEPRDRTGHADTGGASRFFYVAKADQSERPRVNGTAHPTVKPLDLMRWLVRLVTPPGGTVLEPFTGSGTTVEACIVEGFRCVAIEREADYLPLIESRIARRRNPVRAIELAGEDMGLFQIEETA